MLADCLALVAKHQKDCPEFKRSVQNDDGDQEYPEYKGGVEPNEFKPVIWQVFKCPPAQTLYRYTSVLTVIEKAAAEQGVPLAETQKIVALMKGYGSIDRMVDARKKLKNDPKTPEELEEERQDARDEWHKKYAVATALLSERPKIRTIDPQEFDLPDDASLALFVGQRQPNGRMVIRALDAVSYPDDYTIVEMWKEQQAELRSLPDVPTAFLRELTTLAKAIKEPKRPKNAPGTAQTYQRRLRFEPGNDETICHVGPTDTVHGVSLVARTEFLPPQINEPMCLNRTADVNDEAVVADCASRDLTKNENVVRIVPKQGLTKQEVNQGTRAKFVFGDETTSEIALLVDPSRLPGDQMVAPDVSWGGTVSLGKTALKEILAQLQTYKKYQKSVSKTQKRTGGKAFTVHENKKLGYAFGLDVSGSGLVFSNYDGNDIHAVSGVVKKGSAALEEKCRFRTDEWLSCIRALLRVGGVETFTIHYNDDGHCELSAAGSYGSYAFRLAACDEVGTQISTLEAIQ